MIHDDRHSLRGVRLLLVEDDAILAMALEMALSDLGADIVAMASNVQDAIPLARDAAIDGAILDVNLAGEMIFPVSEVLSERGIPYLFATGYGDAALRECDRSRPVLQKPYRVEQIAAIIGRWRKGA